VRILIAAATAQELAPLVADLTALPAPAGRISSFSFSNHHIDVLHTGVGMVATAVWCTRQLSAQRYDLALNAGVCGAFDEALAPGSAVHVISERLPELGAEDGDAFLTMEELNLIARDEAPYAGGQLLNARPPLNPVLAALPQVRGVTVNTVHGREQSIQAIVDRCNPQVESMEGAAFMYACLVESVPFAEIRAVSNVVARRNRAAWKMTEAIAALNGTVRRVLETL
jgi:futalosine hydrolase